MSTYKLPKSIPPEKVIKVLLMVGFEPKKRKSGSHVVFKREGSTVLVTVPLHNQLKIGTLRNILKQASLSRDEFLQLLREV
ncbi:MAG: type II toxin-antitoxin system HicA family toxin [Euryarchaeota archaeon]|nr:type II toxin-antitoxin system HicA family toxin [Euryarchaeota archaeon]